MLRIFHSNTKFPKLRELNENEAIEGSWLHYENPSQTDLENLVNQFGFDIDLLTDGIDPNESPRIEREKDATYIFTRFCLPVDRRESTATLLLVYGSGVVITICTEPFAELHALFGDEPTVTITSKRAQLVVQILGAINLGYKRRINQVSRRILQTRNQLNKSQIANEDFITFIDLEDDLNDFLLVLEPMSGVLAGLLNGRFMRLYEEDKDLIEDLSLGAQELTQLASSRLNTLRNIREAYSTITANNLNKVFKLMTSITILMGIFTLITGIYSMNIRLPAAHNPDAFWIILAVTGILIGSVAVYFKKNKWF